MRVMIAGSIADQTATKAFEDICRSLSKSLDETRHELVIGSDRVDTADFYFYKELKSCGSRKKIKVFYHDNKDAPFKSETERGNLKIEYQRVEGNWEVGRISQVLYSDIILLIGGGNKTENIAKIAHQLNKPIIPIPCIEGASKKYWHNTRQETNALSENDKKLWSRLETWDDDSSNSVVALLEKKYSSLQDKSTSRIYALFILIFLTIALWISCFTGEVKINPMYSLISSLGCATFLGSSLHFLANYLTKEIRRIDLLELLVRTFAGFIVGFSLFILYICSGGVVVGDLTFLDEINKPEELKRVMAWMSMIGLGSGLLLEKSIAGLKEKITKGMDT